MEYIGLRWFKCDFHLHTMCSHCYKNQNDTPEMWVDSIKKSGLQCIAITDHNDYRGIDKVKKMCEENEIIAFPGVELSCSDTKIHMLIIFDSKCNEMDVQEFLYNVGVDKNDLGESGITCQGSIFDVCEKAKKKEALVIAAHIDEFNGINELSYDNLKRLLNREYISAVQIVNKKIWDKILKEEDYENVCEELKEKYGKEISIETVKKWHNAYQMALKFKIPMLTFSDNPSAKGEASHGLWGIGSAYTWMKMNQNPNLESVRQTLLSADMRIKTNIDSEVRPDNMPELWINSLKISNTVLNKNDLKIMFNPQLNCIIGGRGSGKSSIIRMLAGGLQSFDGDNLDKIKEEQEGFYKIPSKDKRGVLSKNSHIEVIFERKGETYKLEITNIKSMKEQCRNLYKMEDEEWVAIDDTNYLDFFHVQVFTQKQIYELALDSTSLLNIIDKAIKEINQKKDEKEILLGKVISKRTEIWNIEKYINEEAKINTEIKDIEEQIVKYEKSGIASALNNKQKYLNQNQILEKYLTDRRNKIEEFEKIIKLYLDSVEPVSTIDNAEIDSLLSRDMTVFEKRKEMIINMVSLLKTDIDNLNKNVLMSGWKKEFELSEQKYVEICTRLKNEGMDFSRLDDLLVQKKDKKLEMEKIEKSKNQVVVSREQLKELSMQYETVAKEISILRSNFIKQVMGVHTNVKFDIQRNRSRDSFIQNMKSIINKDISTIDEDINKLADVFFGKDGKDTFRKQITDIREGLDKKSFSAKLRSSICDVTPEAYARIISFLPEDDLKVSYKPEGNSKYIPLSNASAGQKTTAILTFLLAYGKQPLLLDQPEDDLDNKLVYDLIVSRLKTSKSNRQIIVVTHNANIPVNADSEYIVSMNSETDEISIKCEGTMDDKEIRKEICDVMEGTKYAFEMRAKKYHFNIIE